MKLKLDAIVMGNAEGEFKNFQAFAPWVSVLCRSVCHRKKLFKETGVRVPSHYVATRQWR
jgi:hypothetical protein